MGKMRGGKSRSSYHTIEGAGPRGGDIRYKKSSKGQILAENERINALERMRPSQVEKKYSPSEYDPATHRGNPHVQKMMIFDEAMRAEHGMAWREKLQVDKKGGPSYKSRMDMYYAAQSPAAWGEYVNKKWAERQKKSGQDDSMLGGTSGIPGGHAGFGRER